MHGKEKMEDEKKKFIVFLTREQHACTHVWWMCNTW